MNDKQIANLRADLLQKIRASGADVEEVKQALAELSGDVETCAHMADIAPEFSELENYAAGDLVYNDGVLYWFTSDHTAGAWTGEDAELTDITTLLDDLAGDISDLQPVDAVTIENMHPVTSNAVAVALKQETVTVTKESGDTYGDMLNRMFEAIDFDKVTPKTTLVIGTAVHQIVTWSNVELRFLRGRVGTDTSTLTILENFTVKSTGSGCSTSSISESSQYNHTDNTENAGPLAMTIYY